MDALKREDNFMFIGYIAKLQFDGAVLTRVKVRDDRRYVSLWRVTMMVPNTVRRRLDSILDVY